MFGYKASCDHQVFQKVKQTKQHQKDTDPKSCTWYPKSPALPWRGRHVLARGSITSLRVFFSGLSGRSDGKQGHGGGCRVIFIWVSLYNDPSYIHMVYAPLTSTTQENPNFRDVPSWNECGISPDPSMSLLWNVNSDSLELKMTCAISAPAISGQYCIGFGGKTLPTSCPAAKKKIEKLTL